MYRYPGKTQVTMALLLGSMVAAAPGARAGDGIAELLLKKGIITQTEYQQLKQEAKTEAAAPAASPAPAPAVKVNFDKGVSITSADGASSATLGTLMQFDVAGYNNDGALDNNSGSEMRRGRLNLKGKIHRDWQYKFEMELFGSTGTEVTDAYVRYDGFHPFTGTKPLSITAGHFKIPFSLERLTSIGDVDMMELSLASAFTKSRAPGVMLSSGGDHWSGAAMLFGEQLYSNTKQDEGGGASARVTWAPFAQTGHVLQFGASAQYRKPTQQAGGATIRYSSRPESHMTAISLVDTGTIGGDVDHIALWDAETAASIGSWTVTGEYVRNDVSRNDAPDLAFDGWYVQAAWMLTGEVRPFAADTGLFKSIAPTHSVDAGGAGAWELVARYSAIDLNDANISGGRERNASVGVNWYATNFLRLSGNWVHVLDVSGGPYDGATLNALQMRMQFSY